MAGSGGLPEVDAMIAALQLAPHPEGGWYRETWRSASASRTGGPRRPASSPAAAGERSHWRRVDAEEMWLFQAGAPLKLSIVDGERSPRSFTLGPDPLAGHALQQLVPTGAWQAAEGPGEGWSLVACVVAPGFAFAGFELAPPGWEP